MQRKEKIFQSPTLFGLLGKELSFRLTFNPGWYCVGKNADKQERMKNLGTSQDKQTILDDGDANNEELFLHINPKLNIVLHPIPARKVCWYDAVRFVMNFRDM